MDWDNIQAFLAIFRSGKLAVASRDLGVSEATVRHRLDAVEALGVGPLFERVGGRLTPTSTALKLAQLAERMESDLSSIAVAGPRREVAGDVRVTADELIAVNVLLPLFAILMRRHPNLRLNLGVTAETEDLLLGQADISVRLARPTQKSLVARQVPSGCLGLFAHRDYLLEAGVPANLADLTRFDLIGAGEHDPALAGFRDLGLTPSMANFALRVDGPVGQMQAIRGALGIGAAPVFVAGADPDLVRVLPDIGIDIVAWVSVHEDQRDVPRVRAVFDAIVKLMTARPAAPPEDVAWAPAPTPARPPPDLAARQPHE